MLLLLRVGEVKVCVVRSLFDVKCVRLGKEWLTTGVHVYILNDAWM